MLRETPNQLINLVDSAFASGFPSSLIGLSVAVLGFGKMIFNLAFCCYLQRQSISSGLGKDVFQIPRQLLAFFVSRKLIEKHPATNKNHN
jgi:hypothetical protein